MKSTAGTIMLPISIQAKDTPTAKASILVATANTNISFTPREASASSSSSLDKASLIIFAPIKAKSTNAIQSDTTFTNLAKVVPSKYPSVGINAWNPPNHALTITACLTVSFFIASPLQIDTAKASIDSPTAKRNNVNKSIFSFPPYLRPQVPPRDLYHTAKL